MVVQLNKGEYTATFAPDKGMNLLSLKKAGYELIDPSTRTLFEKRFAGLGALIGPHFHYRHEDAQPKLDNEALFPHIEVSRQMGAKDPFSHGIGRYAPWQIRLSTQDKIGAELRGEDRWQGVPLKDIEGQDFYMSYEALLTSSGLYIDLSVQSVHPSIVGLHTYYALQDKKGRITARVQDSYTDQGVFKPIPSTWNYANHLLQVDLPALQDYGFLPYPDLKQGAVSLETGDKKVKVQFFSDTEELSWQLWQPKEASFVCIEPLSAKNPRKCSANNSKIKILISVQ
jgi:hypothetical protein